MNYWETAVAHRVIVWHAGLLLVLLSAASTAQVDSDMTTSEGEDQRKIEDNHEAQAPGSASAPLKEEGAEAASASTQEGTTAAARLPDAHASKPDSLPIAPAAAATPSEPAAAAPRQVGIVIEQIVVTAQKREQFLSDVPVAISAFSGQDLKALGVTDVRDIGKLVPGMNVSDSGGGTPIYTLRGVGFNDTTYTATGNVGLYVDEVSLPYSAMTKGPSLDLARVEVLKGPQGTLYGRNTTGGLINQIAKKPTHEFDSGFSASYSRFDMKDVEGFVSSPLTDSLRGRIAGRFIHSDDGWQTSNTREDDTLGRQDKGSARALLDWTPDDELFVEAGLHYWFNDGDPQAPQAVALIPQNPFIGGLALAPAIRNYPLVPQKGADPRVADWNPDGDWKLRDSFFMGSLKSIWSMTDKIDLTAIASYIDMKADGSSQIQSGTDVYNVEDTGTQAHIRSKSIEARLSGLWGDRSRWVFGLNAGTDDGGEVHNLRVDSISAFNLLVPTGAGNVNVIPDLQALFPPGPYFVNSQNIVSNHLLVQGFADITQYAAFGSVDWAFADELNLNIGLRYTANNQTFTGCGIEATDSEGIVGLSNVFTVLSAVAAAQYTAQTGQPGKPGVVNKGECWVPAKDGDITPFKEDLNESNASGRIALDWKPEDSALYYASISRGFKAGGFPVVNPANQAQYIPVTQEELFAYEIGAKRGFFNHLFNANLAVFYYDYKDKQLLTKAVDPVFGPLPVLRNAPKSEAYGIELDAQSSPIEGLFIAFAASYLETKVIEFTGTDSEGNDRDFSGRPFNFAPKYQINLITDYTWPVFETMDFGISADMTAVGKTNGTLDENPKFDMPAHQLFGARLHLSATDKQWEFAIFGRNLTDELYSAGTFSVGDVVGRFAGYPRTYGVGVTFNFD